MIDFTVSVVPHLEPFASVAFALNLAYIGLPRFRYRERIREHVSEKLREIDGEPHQFAKTEWYKGPARLAELSDDPSAKEKAELPSESWAKRYTFWFERHRDRKCSIVISIFLGAFLALGSAHSAQHFGSAFGYEFIFLFGDTSFDVWFWSLAFSAMMPVFFVARGNSVVEGACNFADKQIANMKIAKQEEIPSLPIPPVPGKARQEDAASGEDSAD